MLSPLKTIDILEDEVISNETWLLSAVNHKLTHHWNPKHMPNSSQ